MNESIKQINSDIISENFLNIVSQKDPLLLNNFSDIISEIEHSLSKLRSLAINTDFSKITQRQNYYFNINHLKHFYERAERILINDNCD